MPARVPVTAVLVAHDGSRWLPEALSALASQSVEPARVVAVDTGSSDDSAALLRRATGHVIELPRSTGYPAAVAAAVGSLPNDTRWVWLLHDDCAPDPDALSALLREAAADPSVGILGPKVVDWYDPRVLVEIGCSTDGSGVRDTGLEPGEHDQRQHDAPHDVLAVGTAGMLVRRDVWDALGGLDPALPGLRDDLDLGWRANAAGHRVRVVPAARVRHARAVTTGRRPLDSAPGRVAAVDRRAAIEVTLSHAAGWRLVPGLLRLAVGCALRALGLLLARAPREAADELGALVHVLSRPGRLRVARRARAGPLRVAPRELRPLMSSPVQRGRGRLERQLAGRSRAVPGLDEPEPARRDALTRLRTSPWLGLGAGLVLITLLAARELIGRGVLAGGRLLPAPESAGDLWAGYAASAEPALAVLAVLATLLLGQADLAVELLLLGSVPAAGVVAYAVAGRLVRSPLLQSWAGATWALLPVATGAVSAGRLGVAVVHVALPALLLLGHSVVTADTRRRGWQRAWVLGLALAAAVALAPVLWPLSLLLLVGVALLGVGAAAPARRPAARRRVVAAVVAAGVPVLLLLPWSPDLLGVHSLLHGFGRVGPELSDPVLPAWHLLLLQPGGPGTTAVAVTAPLLLAALAGLLRTRRAQVAAAGWGLALVGLAAALVVARSAAAGAAGWPGVPLDLAAAGMLVSALIGAEGLQGSLARASFGWRQVTAVLVVLAATAVPVVSAVDWVRRGADGPLQRADADLLPAFATAELRAAPDRRALLLAERADGAVGYALTGAQGARLGDVVVDVDDVVTGLLAPSGTRPALAAAAEGVEFVALTGGSVEVAAALDAQPGLDRQPGGALDLWRVTPEAAPARTPGNELGVPALAAQAAVALVVAVLAGPGTRPRRGLVREPRR